MYIVLIVSGKSSLILFIEVLSIGKANIQISNGFLGITDGITHSPALHNLFLLCTYYILTQNLSALHDSLNSPIYTF